MGGAGWTSVGAGEDHLGCGDYEGSSLSLPPKRLLSAVTSGTIGSVSAPLSLESSSLTGAGRGRSHPTP